MRLSNDFKFSGVYLDTAATSLKPKSVVNSYYKAFTNYFDVKKARLNISEFLNTSPDKIKFTRGTTHSLNILANYYKNNLKRVGISISEHHSNILPWQRIAELEYIYTSEGMDSFNNVDLISLSHVSNVLGTIRDIKKSEKILVIDGAQAPSNIRVDLNSIDCDFYLFSGHKIYGPTGIGVLYDKNNLIDEDYENIPAIAGLNEAIKYLDSNWHLVEDEHKLSDYAIKELNGLGVNVISAGKKKAPIISFDIPGIHPHDISTFLSNDNICIRAGHMCAETLMTHLGFSALSRISLGIYNNMQDIEKFLDSIVKLKKFFL
jgi:cysteine desulfurase/selenocysteine lyase